MALKFRVAVIRTVDYIQYVEVESDNYKSAQLAAHNHIDETNWDYLGDEVSAGSSIVLIAP